MDEELLAVVLVIVHARISTGRDYSLESVLREARQIIAAVEYPNTTKRKNR
jgi:hypothetical protein